MNPHTRYEIRIDRQSRRLALAACILTMIALVGSVWLAATTPGQIIPIDTRHVHFPKVLSSAEIQKKVDAKNPVVQAVEGRVR